MPRPTAYTPAKAEAALVAILDGATQAEAARRAGVSRRTLQSWAARGRADRAGPFGSFAFRLDLRAERARRRKVRASWARYHAAKAANWQRFRESREGWWMERLGPVEFWRRRLEWAEAKGRHEAAREAAERLREAEADGEPGLHRMPASRVL